MESLGLELSFHVFVGGFDSIAKGKKLFFNNLHFFQLSSPDMEVKNVLILNAIIFSLMQENRGRGDAVFGCHYGGNGAERVSCTIF